MNINAIQEALDGLNDKPKKAGGNTKRKQFGWKPQIGKHTVRILPSVTNSDNPFKEVFFHYGIGKRTIISPINFGERDPILEFSKELRKSTEPEDWKLAKKLEPKMRVFVPVLVRGMEEQGVKLWDFGKTVYQSLLSMATDEEIGDYTDPLEGRDIKIECTKGDPYKKTEVRISLKAGPISQDSELMEKVLKEQPQPEELYKQYTFDEIKGFLKEWLDGDETEDKKPESNGLTDADVNNIFKKKNEESEKSASIIDGPATDFTPSNEPIPSSQKKQQAVASNVTDEEFDALFQEDK